MSDATDSLDSTGRSTGRLRAVALVLVLLALLVVAAALVPWHVLGEGAPPVRPTPRADFTAQQLATEAAFHDALRSWTYPRLALAVVVPVLLGLTPAGARLVRASARWARGAWPVQVVLGTVVLTLVTVVVTLPLSVGAETVLRDYGLSTQTWPQWVVDVSRGWAVSAAVTALILLVVVGLARRWRRWWLAGAAVAAAAVVVGSFVYPVVIEPLSNRFTPMATGPQRQDLLRLAERDGINVDDVLVADASRRTTTENAYVSGLGGTRRIVVYDTLLRGASPQEVKLVVAHELGHVAAHDVRLGTTLGALGAAAAVLTGSWLLEPEGRRRRRLLRRAGARDLGDPAAIALVLALVTVGSFVVAPVSNVVSRRIEARADVHALDLTRDVEGFTRMQRRLAVTNLSDLQPAWWRTAIFGTHPPSPWRIAMARVWAEQHGLPVPHTPPAE